jgi:rare lipoprotein A
LPDRRSAAASLAALIVLSAASACARLPRPVRPAGAETGIASWYGEEFHGRPTSSREIYDMNDMTAAHRTLPFGTYVMVTNLGNDRSVVVRVNDRGPFVRGRVIDLSYAAASVIGLVGPGTARVRIEALKGFKAPASSERRGIVWIQVGAYTAQESAYAIKKKLDASFRKVAVTRFESPMAVFYRVRVQAEEGEAAGLARRLAAEGYPVIIVRE